MADTDDVVHITQTEFEQLICHDARRVTESEETMVREHGVQAHRSSMK